MRTELTQLREAFETDARITHRLLSLQAAQAESLAQLIHQYAAHGKNSAGALQ